MKRVEPGDGHYTDLGTMMNQQAEAQQTQPTEIGTIYVWTLETTAAVHRGAHTTSAGAWLALRNKAIEQSHGTLSISSNADLTQINAALRSARFVREFGMSSMTLTKP